MASGPLDPVRADSWSSDPTLCVLQPKKRRAWLKHHNRWMMRTGRDCPLNTGPALSMGIGILGRYQVGASVEMAFAFCNVTPSATSPFHYVNPTLQYPSATLPLRYVTSLSGSVGWPTIPTLCYVTRTLIGRYVTLRFLALWLCPWANDAVRLARRTFCAPLTGRGGQSLVFKEMVSVRYSAAKERDMPLFRTLQWSWFAVAIFYAYGDFLHEFVLQHRALLWLSPFTMYHAWFSFVLYCCVFVVSVLTLKKGLYKYQVTLCRGAWEGNSERGLRRACRR